jgi:tetratricopeptide (TPR) repeat protein
MPAGVVDECRSLVEVLAARYMGRSGWLSLRAAPPATGLGRAWRACLAGLLVALVLAGLAVVAVSLRHGPAGLPSPGDLQQLRDYLLVTLEVAVLVAALVLLAVVLVWLVHSDPAVISPFANATATGSLIAVSDLLVGHLDRISAVQRTPIADIPGERLRSSPVEPKPETIDSSLANVGSINLGQASISVGQLLIALKRMLPLRNRGTTISGSVQQYGGRIQLVATVRRGRLMDTCMAGGAAGDDDTAILALVPELAYRIHFALAGRRMAARTWELLRCFTEARAAYQRYLNGGRGEDRDLAVALTAQAYAMDCTYPRLFGLLYGLGTCFFGAGELPAAIGLFRSALSIQPGTPQALVQLARCHYARADDEEALRVLGQALARPRCHPAARYLLGLIHATAGRHGQAIEELARVRHHPRSLRSSAWVTIGGLRLQAGDERGYRLALRHVAARDFEPDAYSRACWLSVTGDHDGAAEALRQVFCRHLVPLEYALRDPDLLFVREHRALPDLRDVACRAVALDLAGQVAAGAGRPNGQALAAGA